MNILLWVLQVLAALLYAASGVMKTFKSGSLSESLLISVSRKEYTWPLAVTRFKSLRMPGCAGCR